MPFLIENPKDSAKTPKNWTFKSSETAEKILLKFPFPAPSDCSQQGSRRCWQHPPIPCHHRGQLRATGTDRRDSEGKNKYSKHRAQMCCVGWGKAGLVPAGSQTQSILSPSHQCLAFHESLSTSRMFPGWKWAIITLCLCRATSQILLSTVHCQGRALHVELSTELKGSKKNRSSTEVESFKELNLSYTINLYIPGMTNTQQQVLALGCFSSWRYHAARGISSRCARLGLGPQLKGSGLATPAWSLTENKQPVPHVLDLTSLTSLWRNKEWMIKASQEKQVFVCTSTKKNLHCHHQSAFWEEKKNQWQKLPQIGTQFVEHRQNKNQTKTQEISQQKSTACIPILFGNFCSL